jgi:hypothetical protein
MLREIVARRVSSRAKLSSRRLTASLLPQDGATFLDEMRDIIPLRPLDSKAFQQQVDPETVMLPASVLDQLEDFIGEIAATYDSANPFHNFEHASRKSIGVN